MVQQRLSRMAPNAAAAVEIAAVAGRQFELRRCRRGGRARGARARLRRRVRRPATGSSRSCRSRPDRAASRTSSCRRAIYDRITVIRRAELHLRVGRGSRARPRGRARPRAPGARPPLHAGGPGCRRPAGRHVQPPARRGCHRGRGVRGRGRQAEDRARDSASPIPRSAPERRSISATSSRRPATSPTPRRVLADSLNAASGLAERGVAAHALMHRLGARLADPLLDLEAQQRGFEQVIETFEEPRRRAWPRPGAAPPRRDADPSRPARAGGPRAPARARARERLGRQDDAPPRDGDARAQPEHGS